MNWYFYQTNNCKIIADFFDFNKILYTPINLWDNHLDGGRHDINQELLTATKSGLIMSIDVLNDLLDWPISRQHVINFLCNNNYIWAWCDIDGFKMTDRGQKNLVDIDTLIPKNKLSIFIDALPSDNHSILKLCNINIKIIKHNWFMKLPRIFSACTDKIATSKDFLLTALKKPNRYHRHVLWKELNSRNGLINKGNVSYQKPENKLIWTDGPDGILSMELYRDSWLEIVPETIYKTGYYFTEKIAKPLGTKTPFLVVSTCGYLEYLKSLGFRTFDTLINESYDQQHRVEDRVKLIVNQLEDIVRNGTQSFYHASQSILDHNYNRLAEISGNWQNNMDSFIQHALDQIESD